MKLFSVWIELKNIREYDVQTYSCANTSTANLKKHLQVSKEILND